MQPLSWNQRPDPLTSLMKMYLVNSCSAPATQNASLQLLFKIPHMPSFLEALQNPHVWLTFNKVQSPLPPPGKESTTNLVCFYHFDFDTRFATTACNFQALIFRSAPRLPAPWRRLARVGQELACPGGGGQLLQRPADPRFPAAVDNPQPARQ